MEKVSYKPTDHYGTIQIYVKCAAEVQGEGEKLRIEACKI